MNTTQRLQESCKYISVIKYAEQLQIVPLETARDRKCAGEGVQAFCSPEANDPVPSLWSQNSKQSRFWPGWMRSFTDMWPMRRVRKGRRSKALDWRREGAGSRGQVAGQWEVARVNASVWVMGLPKSQAPQTVRRPMACSRAPQRCLGAEPAPVQPPLCTDWSVLDLNKSPSSSQWATSAAWPLFFSSFTTQRYVYWNMYKNMYMHQMTLSDLTWHLLSRCTTLLWLQSMPWSHKVHIQDTRVMQNCQVLLQQHLIVPLINGCTHH